MLYKIVVAMRVKLENGNEDGSQKRRCEVDVGWKSEWDPGKRVDLMACMWHVGRIAEEPRPRPRPRRDRGVPP